MRGHARLLRSYARLAASNTTAHGGSNRGIAAAGRGGWSRRCPMCEHCPRHPTGERPMDPTRLKGIPLFGTLPEKQLKTAARLADEVEVKEGTHLVDEGRFAHEFFVIEDGKADVVHDGKKIAELGPGDF